MGLADAFAPAEAYYASQVRAATWGHLRPVKNKTYSGRVVWALGCLGSDNLNPTILTIEMGELDSSPWLCEFLQDELGKHSAEGGRVFEFRGTFRNYKLKGSIQCLFSSEETKTLPVMKSSRFSRKNYVAIAATIAALIKKTDRTEMYEAHALRFEKDNPRFDRERFRVACNA